MGGSTLEDHLRRATRNFTSALPEDDALTLGRDLALELARAHAEAPPRHPELEPSAIAMEDGHPRLVGGSGPGDVGDDLFQLGSLLHWIAAGLRPEVSWRLDGPPPTALSTVARRAVLAVLAAPSGPRFASARDAAEAMEATLAPPAASPWPLFRGSVDRTGARPATAPLRAVAPAWETRLGGVVSSPAVTSAFVLANTSDGRLAFLDRRSGRRVHEVKIGSATESSPALVGDLVAAGNDDGELVVVELASGSVKHRLRLGQLVRSSPLAFDDRLIVGVVESRNSGALVAVEAASGKLVWTRKLGAVFSSPARAGSRLVVGSDDGLVQALDAATGALQWSFEVGGKVRATPAVLGDVAVVGGFGGRLVALGVEDGKPRWTREVGHTIYSSAATSAEAVVVGCHDGHVHGSDAAGNARFEAQTRGPVIASPVLFGDRVLVGSTDGSLYLLDLAGQVLSSLRLSKDGIQSSAALADGVAYIGSADGLHALRLVP